MPHRSDSNPQAAYVPHCTKAGVLVDIDASVIVVNVTEQCLSLAHNYIIQLAPIWQ